MTLKQIFQIGFVLCFGIFMSLLAIEILFRLLWRPDPKWNDRPFAYYKPELSETMQDYPHDPQKRPADFRIAVVGDSYTFAPFMQFTDAFPKRLEQMLNLNNTQHKVEVINYGVPAYSTSHEVASVETALKQGADLVILQITLNDPELKPFRPIGIGNFKSFGPWEPGPLMAAITSHWRSLGYILNRIHNSITAKAYKNYFIDLFENPKSFKVFKESLTHINNLCKEKNVKFFAAVFPLFGMPMDDNYPFKALHEKVAATLNELGAGSLDLFETYKGIPIDRLQVIPGGDRHPNEIAHRLAAESIYRYLFANKLVPEEFKIKYLFSDRTRIVKEPEYIEGAPAAR